MKKTHSFHIPVMGIGFTIDTPLKVAQYGMDSVISLVDDILLEKLRKMYCDKFEVPYNEITDKIDDFRAKRITSYLNLISDLANKKFESLKDITSEKSDEFSPTRLLKKSVSAESDITRTLPYLLLLPQVQ